MASTSKHSCSDPKNFKTAAQRSFYEYTDAIFEAHAKGEKLDGTPFDPAVSFAIMKEEDFKPRNAEEKGAVPIGSKLKRCVTFQTEDQILLIEMKLVTLDGARYVRISRFFKRTAAGKLEDEQKPVIEEWSADCHISSSGSPEGAVELP